MMRKSSTILLQKQLNAPDKAVDSCQKLSYGSLIIFEFKSGHKFHRKQRYLKKRYVLRRQMTFTAQYGKNPALYTYRDLM